MQIPFFSTLTFVLLCPFLHVQPIFNLELFSKYNFFIQTRLFSGLKTYFLLLWMEQVVLYGSKQIFNQIRMFILQSARVKDGESLAFRPPFNVRNMANL